MCVQDRIAISLCAHGMARFKGEGMAEPSCRRLSLPCFACRQVRVPARRRGRTPLCYSCYGRRIAESPHALEIVEAAHLWSEQVDDYVACIEQDPIGRRKTFELHRAEACLLDLFGQLLCHRGDLTGRAARCDHHVIGNRAFALEIDGHDLLSLVIVELLQHKGKQRIKIIARYQQYEGANKLVERVVAGHPKKGLIWHFQGSGKSLLMLFAARKLRLHPALKNPTVMVLVDRIDLDSQISSTFYANDAQNLVKAESRKDLQDLLERDVRKIIITTIHKFGEADGELNDRENIIVLVDEAHRTQEGDLGRKMREALPNAFLFGLTGTPINRADKNTFYAFGAEEDENGYMSRYGFEESIRDGATLPLHFHDQGDATKTPGSICSRNLRA